MMQRFRIFLVVLLLMFTTKFFGQNIPQNIFNGITIQEILTHIKIKSFAKDLTKDKLNYIMESKTQLVKDNNTNDLIKPFNTSRFKDFLILNEGVLCRVEYKFQKATNVPLRLRLGSLDYTNYLEQKPNALKPN